MIWRRLLKHLQEIPDNYLLGEVVAVVWRLEIDGDIAERGDLVGGEPILILER